MLKRQNSLAMLIKTTTINKERKSRLSDFGTPALYVKRKLSNTFELLKKRKHTKNLISTQCDFEA